jgi:uncharacterized protein YcfL
MNKIIIPALTAALLAGCSTSTTSNEVHGSEGGSYEYIAANSTLSRVAEVLSVNSTIAEDGSSLKLVVTVRNNSNAQQYAKYTVTWLDESGAPVAGALEVTRQVTLPTGRSTFSAVATSPRAKKYKLLLSETK